MSSPLPTREQLLGNLDETDQLVNILLCALERIHKEFLPTLASENANVDLASSNEESLLDIATKCGTARYTVIKMQSDVEKLAQVAPASNVSWVQPIYWDEHLQEKANAVGEKVEYLGRCVESIKMDWAVEGGWN
ncbi:hypothetical protein EV426DRAFT_710561 [Tirmania nivea]|nr:hypothetical protein EV426DRAFT_710561 [Tirmania nivea]